MKTRHSTHEKTIIFPSFVHKNKEKHDVFAKGGGGGGGGGGRGNMTIILPLFPW